MEEEQDTDVFIQTSFVISKNWPCLGITSLDTISCKIVISFLPEDGRFASSTYTYYFNITSFFVFLNGKFLNFLSYLLILYYNVSDFF